MDNLKEKLDTLIAQHQQVAQQANDALTMKTKLEGAIELVQQLMEEENSKDGEILKDEVAEGIAKGRPVKGKAK